MSQESVAKVMKVEILLKVDDRCSKLGGIK